MDAIARAREESQPLRSRTGGSTFKNPPGHKAWALVDAAGCRGLTMGDAQVSEKHCNFLLNLGSATSADIEALGEEVRRRVKAKTNIILEWEIQRVGQRMNRDIHVVVLMGGWSTEREVSLTSGKGVADALRERGWSNVTELDMDRDVARRLAELKPDVVFNALHGTPGEDGTVQGMMDLMGLKYTHSGLETSVIAIDKELTKMVLVPHGIRMPAGKVVESESLYQRGPDGAALRAQAGQRRLVGRRRDRHRRRQLRQPDRPRRRRARGTISTSCSPSRSSRAAS